MFASITVDFMQTLIYQLSSKFVQEMMMSSKCTVHHAFILFCIRSLTVTKMFINIIISEIRVVSVVKGFPANFDDKI